MSVGLFLLFSLLGYGSEEFNLTSPTGEKAFCKVFMSGAGSCYYDSLGACMKDINESDEGCSKNKIGSKVHLKQQAKQISGRKSKQHIPSDDEKRGVVTIGKCYPFVAYQSFGYQIVRKLGDKSYELMGKPWPTMSSHAILKTKQTNFKGTGMLSIPMMKRTGSKKVQLINGFEGIVELWEECKCPDGSSDPMKFCDQL